MAEAAFSENGKYYAAISSDGKLKIWDTETSVLKQEYTPDLHLTSPPTCLQWIIAGQSKQGKKTASASEVENQCIALGTSNGKILIYSVAQTKVRMVIQMGTSKVTGLDWHRKYGLFSCLSKENLVLECDLQTAAIRNKYLVGVDSKMKQGNNISAIKIVPHNLETKALYLITASWQVRLWRLCNGDATLVKTLGHNASQTAVLALAAYKNNCWLIEGSQNERLLSFWDVTITEDHEPQVNGEETPHKKKRKKSLTNITNVTNASYNFVLEDAPRIVDVRLNEEDGAMRVSLAAATRSGVVHYYGQMLNGSSIKPLKPSVTLQVSSPEASPFPLQCCRLRPAGDILLGYSQPPALVFETVTIDLKTKTQVIIRGETKPAKKSKQHNEVNKVRSDHRSSSAQLVEPMGGVAVRKRVAPGAPIEVPMEARLANLSLEVNKNAPVDQNMSKLLVQGLQSNDKSILKLVLQTRDSRVAENTVSRLPAQCVPLLIDRLADMASKKTTTCLAVCTWLQALTTRHGALLLAQLSSSQADHLTRLLAVFTHRRSHLCQLMNLKGRVELTIKQRQATEKQQEENQKPLLQYRDDTSDEEEIHAMKVDNYKSDSDESWDDDNTDAEPDGDQDMEASSSDDSDDSDGDASDDGSSNDDDDKDDD